MKRIIICLTFLIVIIEIAFSIMMADLDQVSGQPMLDMTYYNSDIFYDRIAAYGQEGLAIYNKMQILDSIFPLVYGILLFLVLKSLNSPLVWMPILGMSFDYLENISNFILIRWPMAGVPTFTFGFTALKFICLALSVAMLLFQWIQKTSRTQTTR